MLPHALCIGRLTTFRGAVIPIQASSVFQAAVILHLCGTATVC